MGMEVEVLKTNQKNRNSKFLKRFWNQKFYYIKIGYEFGTRVALYVMRNGKNWKIESFFPGKKIRTVDLKSIINITEKRADARHDCKAIIKWSYFNKDAYFNAKLLNFSRGGAYIETAHDIKPRATIFIQVEMVLSSKVNSLDYGRLRYVSLGEVKWRIDLSGNDQSYYGVGVRYPFPAWV